MPPRIVGVPQKPLSALQQTIDAVLQAISGLFTQAIVKRTQTSSASISSTTLVLGAASGWYRVSVYAVASNSVAGTLAVSVTFTDSVGSQTDPVIPATAVLTGGFVKGDTLFYTPGGTIAFSTTKANTITYNIHIAVEKL